MHAKPIFIAGYIPKHEKADKDSVSCIAREGYENASFGIIEEGLSNANEGTVSDSTEGGLSVTSIYGKTYGYDSDYIALFTRYSDTDTIMGRTGLQ